MSNVDLSIRYHRYAPSFGWSAVEGKVVRESSVSLTINGEVWLTFLCTPRNLEDLAVGFLYNENVIQSFDEVIDVRPCADGTNVDVWLAHPVVKPATWKRTSGCAGGITSGDAIVSFPRVNITISIDPAVLLACMDQLLQSQEIYRETGGIHCSALSDGKRVIVQAEDIGRHNTLDKLAGNLVQHPVNVQPRIILTTGRVSSEMLQKSARLEASVVMSRTAATSESVRLAGELGITLVGYARRAQLLVYTHPERLGVPLHVQDSLSQ